MEEKKIKNLIKKSETLRRIIIQPEKEVSRASLLNAKNLYKLLAFLRDIYPIGCSFKKLKEKMNLEIFSEHSLDQLRLDNLILKRDLELSEKLRETINPKFLEGYPEYVITSNGMEFLNNIEIRDLSRKIENLTRILILFGGITILLMILQFVCKMI